MFNVEGETAQTKHLHSLRSSDHSIASPAGWSSNSSGTPPRSNPKPSTSRTSKDTLARAPSTPAHHISTPTTTRNTNDTMLGLRTATRASSALPVFRNAAARRFNSSVGAKGLEGPADNAFNRERAAVKQHAADTSGKWAWRWTGGIGHKGREGRLGRQYGGLGWKKSGRGAV